MTNNTAAKFRIVLFGTADLNNPRTRILLDGLKRAGNTVTLCHEDIWQNNQDRSQFAGILKTATLFLRWLWAMARLCARYVTLPDHDIVVVCYPGHVDIWFAKLFASLRRKPLVWDAFISAYDTVVGDRKLAAPGSLTGKACFYLDKTACGLADMTLLDTEAHAAFFSKCFDIPAARFAVVPVGAEQQFIDWSPADGSPRNGQQFTAVFYGKFIPLHGIPTILEAVRILKAEDIHFTLVGGGQTADDTRLWLEAHPLPNLVWLPWVNYEDLPAFLSGHALGLGIFSDGDKAGRVVPNKIFQMLAIGLPVLTRQSDAIHPYEGKSAGAISTVPAACPRALADAIRAAKAEWTKGTLDPVPPELVTGPSEVGLIAHQALIQLLANRSKA
ncbi:glycosyltransferase [Kordiimonas aestuarii]|uniref:glycosyltransferase n=1 Tax=Kordiimonas aestuarii TaxID=1005925 RepID=UPI0021CEBDB1|nr:glycosyltransferase [Kordiimonas aestuarii]